MGSPEGREPTRARVDVVAPAYNEDPAAVLATVQAVLRQDEPVASMIVVDDRSREPVELPTGIDPRVRVLRMPQNGGISAARNAGLREGTAPFISFLNIEVLPRTDWTKVCSAYLDANPEVGVITVRTTPDDPANRRAMWRSLVQEIQYPKATGPIGWGPGHVLFFRRTAVEAVGGFDESKRKAGEDVDICKRLSEAGWGVHFVAETEATSIQVDSYPALARAEYNRFTWRGDSGIGFVRAIGIATNRALQRSIVHTVRLRPSLIPVEIGVWLATFPFAWRFR
jgi:GT2 family glycosyltransferase